MQYEYKVVETNNSSSLETRINEHAENGYRVIHFSPVTHSNVAGGTTRTSYCAIMEKQVSQNSEQSWSPPQSD